MCHLSFEEEREEGGKHPQTTVASEVCETARGSPSMRGILIAVGKTMKVAMMIIQLATTAECSIYTILTHVAGKPVLECTSLTLLFLYDH